MMNFGSNRQERDQAKLAALADPRLAEARRRRVEGDWLDKGEVRERATNATEAALLTAGLTMFAADLAFGWLAGAVAFPWLKLGGVAWGGLVVCANSFAFIWIVKKYREEGRTFRRNRWSALMASSFAFAVLMIFVSQTSAADGVRAIVDHREKLVKEIGQLDAEIAQTFIASRRPVEASLEGALNEAVGSHLNTVEPEAAAASCHHELDLARRLDCKQKILRDSVDCAQDMKPLVRDATCSPIAMYKAKLATLDQEERDLATKRGRRDAKAAELKALPEATNYFIQALASITGWKIDDAQSRFYMAVALFFIIPPALIFSMTIERRRAAPPPASPASI